MFLGGFEIIVVIGIIVWLTRRSRAKKAETSSAPVNEVLLTWLRRWETAGLISGDDVGSIIAFEQNNERASDSSDTNAATEERKMPLVAEALGYLGGLLSVIGVIMLVARYWPDLATGWRIGLPAAVAVAGVAGGALVNEDGDDALRRLKWSLWLVGTAGLGAAGGVAMYDAMDPIPAYGWTSEHRIVFGVASLVALLSAVLWRGKPRPLQQLTFLGGLAVSVGAAANEWWELSVVGLVVWVSGAAMLLIAHREIGTYPVLTGVVGGFFMVVGSTMMFDRWGTAGALFLVVTSAVLIGLGQRPIRSTNEDLVPAFLVAGALSLVLNVPTVLIEFADDDGMVTGLAVWVIGVVSYAVGERGSVRVPTVMLIIGGAGIVIGPAISASDLTGVGTIVGLISAVVCLAVGATPGRVVLSFIGAGSLLIYVPWSIAHFFPGEGRAPLLIAASGVLIVGVALFLARSARRLSSEFEPESS